MQLETPDLSTLPDNFSILLDNCGAISLSGEEQSKYLQGQVTCDVNALTEHNWLMGAHCNAKGKVFSNFRLANHQGNYLLIQPNSTLTASLAELKKFAVFAKVAIESASDLAFAIFVGNNITDSLRTKFTQLPDSLNSAVSDNSLTLLYLTGNKPTYLLIGNKQEVVSILDSIELPRMSSSVWTLLEIENGIPFLNNTTQEFVPQMLNLQAINGISFTKGCYLGQETVARMQYLGKNKKALFSCQGQCQHKISDLVVEKQIGKHWRKAGDVISWYQASNGKCYIQLVMASDTNNTTKLRIQSQDQGELSILPLPYSLSE